MIIDQALQSSIQNGKYYIKYQKWSLNFWIQISASSNIQNYTIFTFNNNLNQKITFQIDSLSTLMIQKLNLTFLNFSVVQHPTQSLIQNFLDRKTESFFWTPGSFSYINQNFYITLTREEQSLQTYDFSFDTGSYIDFTQVENSRDVFFNQVIIRDFVLDAGSFYSYYYNPHMLAFYNFDYISDNKKTVKNLVNKKQFQNLYIQDAYQLPSDINLKYNKKNYFSSFRIQYPTFWSSPAFYCIQMVMNFSYIYKKNMLNQSTPGIINFVLYQRQFIYTSNSITANMSVNFQYNNTLQFPVENHFQFSYDQTVQHTSFFEKQITYAQNFTNYIYSMNLCNLHQHSGRQTISINSKLNDEIFMDNTQIQSNFSDKDIHQSYIQDQNYYFDVLIDKILFYQNFFVGNANIVGYPDIVQTKCLLDNSIPYSQQSSLINNTEKIVLSNCTQTYPLQQCHSYPNCLECNNIQCLRCKDNFYMEDSKCLKCEFPYIIINQNCIFPDKVMYFNFSEVNQAFSSLQILFQYIFQDAKSLTQTISNLRILFVKKDVVYKVQYDYNIYLQDQIVQNPFSTLSFIEQYEYYYSYFFTNFNSDNVSARISIVHTSVLNINNINRYKSYFCPKTKLIFNVQKDIYKCVDNCPIDSYLVDNKMCVKNRSECLQYQHNDILNCIQCNTGYISIAISQISTCICTDINYCQKQLQHNENQDYTNNYQNFTYRIDSIQYRICDISMNQYFDKITKTCELNNNSINHYCTLIDQQGNCLNSTLNKYTKGYIFDDTALKFNASFYFQNNSPDLFFDYYLNKNCDSLIPYRATLYQDAYCINQSHIRNGAIFTCLLDDINCSSCFQQNIRQCTQCQTGTLSVYESYTICEQAQSGCVKHVKYDQQILCEECGTQQLYLKEDQIYGICIAFLVDYCIDYEMNLNNAYCTQCEMNYILVIFQNICISDVFQVQYCKQYLYHQVTQTYLCQQCENQYLCVDLNIQNNTCRKCLSNTYSILNCISYDLNYQCTKCDQNFVLQNDSCFFLIPNCNIYSQTINNICEQCEQDFILSSDRRQCIQIKNCIKYDAEGLCLQCDDSFCLFENKCILCVENCFFYFSDFCNQCNENYILDRQKNICLENQTEMIEAQGVIIQGCIYNIEACVDCLSQNQCVKCEENYYLQNSSCIPNCLQLDFNCNQCNNFNQSICQYCKTGYIIYNNKCTDPCQEDIQGFICLQKKCLYFDKQCIKCINQNPDLCEICIDGYELDEYFKCISKQVVVIEEPIYQCDELCLECFKNQCVQCIQGSYVLDGICHQAQQQNTQSIEEIQQNQCKSPVICMSNNTKKNRQCQQCNKLCDIQHQFIGRKLFIKTNEKIQFNSNLQNNQDYFLKFDQNIQNQFEVIFLDLNSKKYVYTQSGIQLISLSQDCYPAPIYQFELTQDLYVSENIKKITQTLSNSVVSSLYNIVNFFLPQWLRLMFIDVIQKIELFSYIGYLNLDGGQLFNFMNSFQEGYVKSIIAIRAQDEKKNYEMQFQQLHYQIDYFNTFDELSILSIQMFLITIIFKIIKHILKQKRKKAKANLQEIFSYQQQEMQFFLDSFIISISFYTVPQNQ